MLQTRAWEYILERLLKAPEFVSQLNQRGYYLSPKGISFRDYCIKNWGITPTRNTAAFLSINFWHEQPKILRNEQKYLVRTGEGTFAIFNAGETTIFGIPHPSGARVSKAEWDIARKKVNESLRPAVTSRIYWSGEVSRS